uniref:Uncharacterized protein n=1 Tax=Acrobeloides nanus TaxID=290746 RepID=A0A914CIN9_9BILA
MSKCRDKHNLRVYVYPDGRDVIHSKVYENILKVLRESRYYTQNPEEACLFVLSIDTIDRDRISESYIKDVNAQIKALPPELWNEGRNHIIFNLYHGTYPDYSDHDLGFDVGYAMIARASASTQNHRGCFDLSFPLFHKEHPVRSVPQTPIVEDLDEDAHLVSFKGKRYVYGIGSETRDSLHHLHNGNSCVIATTCKHNSDWKKFEDGRCAMDNEEYDKWDYNYLLENSTFCLTPRGRRLGSFRFLESLRAGCIPVVLSDEWELPFSEVIDWSKAALVVEERNVLFVTDMLWDIPKEKILQMKLQTKLLFHKYFSSVEKIISTTLKIIFERLEGEYREHKDWNKLIEFEENLLEPKFTIVIQGILRYSSRLNRIVTMVSEISGIHKIILLWPIPRGQPPEIEAFRTNIPIEIIQVEQVDQSEFFKLNYHNFGGDFVVFLDERVNITAKEIQATLNFALENPAQMSSFHALHYNQEEKGYQINAPQGVDFSIGLLHFAIVPRHFLIEYPNYLTNILISYANALPQCHILFFNFMLADLTLNPPFLVGQRAIEPWMLNRNYTICFNKIIHSYWFDQIPVLNSIVRQNLHF